MVSWKYLSDNVDLGPLEYMLTERDPRSAREQLDTGYKHGGGWNPFQGFRLTGNNSLVYPGDPPIHPIAIAYLRDEQINLYPSDWVAIIQPDRTFEVCRMD